MIVIVVIGIGLYEEAAKIRTKSTPRWFYRVLNGALALIRGGLVMLTLLRTMPLIPIEPSNPGIVLVALATIAGVVSNSCSHHVKGKSGVEYSFGYIYRFLTESL